MKISEVLAELKTTRTNLQNQKNLIRDLLIRSDKAVVVAIVRLYEHQTSFEKESKSTVDHNGIGFSAFDAFSGTNFARMINRKKLLSSGQIEKARKISLRYTTQLAIMALRKQASTKEC